MSLGEAAWAKDRGAARVTLEASMGKMFATEAAQRVIDAAVQLHGGMGVTQALRIGRYYRRALMLDSLHGTADWALEALSEFPQHPH